MTHMADAARRAGGPRVRNAEATRADLLRAAMRRFTVLGYERTTARDIAADAGVNVALISRYFGSKDGLFEAVMRESANSLEQFRAAQPAGLVDAVLSQLGPDQWPEFGHEHPLVLLLRDIGKDERIAELRRLSLHSAITQLIAQTAPAPPTPASPSRDATVRAELALALIAGVLTLRAALPDSELAVADKDRLRLALEHAITAILSTPPAG
jgi:AcrR family transcriptional regulator